MPIFELYEAVSILLSLVAICNCCATYKQFYLTIEYLTTSKPHELILLTVLLGAVFTIFVCIVAKFVNLFFGEVKEIERIFAYKKVIKKNYRIALMIIFFREDVLVLYPLGFYVGLLTLSALHWIAIKRSEFLVFEGMINKSKYIKLLTAFLLLCWIDFLILEYFYHNVYLKASGKANHGQLFKCLLGSEFLILAMDSVLPFIKYVINIVELTTYSNYESKATAFSILEFICKMTKLIIKLLMINFISKNFQLPISLLGGEYFAILAKLISTIKKFYNTVCNTILLVVRLKKLPDVTQRDIAEIDSVCLICLQDIHSGKKIPCGHIFHFNCLKTWIEGNTNQFCPKCKRPIKIELKKSMLENAVASLALEDAASESFRVNLILKELSEEDKMPLKKLGSFKYGLPCKAVNYKSQKVEMMRKKVKLLNNRLVLGTKLEHSLLKSELLRHLNGNNVAQLRQDADQPNLDRAQSVPQVLSSKTANSQKQNDSMLHRSILNVLSRHVSKSLQHQQRVKESPQQMHDAIEEGLRRHQLLLEAAERRMQRLAQNSSQTIIRSCQRPRKLNKICKRDQNSAFF